MNNVEKSVEQEIVTNVALEELDEERMATVVGGALLLPAVQKATAARPTETLSLNF